MGRKAKKSKVASCDPEQLRKWYQDDCLTTWEISKRTEASSGSVIYWLNKYGIITERNPDLPTCEELEDAYNAELLSIREIGEKYNVAPITVQKWFGQCSIVARKPHETIQLKRENIRKRRIGLMTQQPTTSRGKTIEHTKQKAAMPDAAYVKLDNAITVLEDNLGLADSAINQWTLQRKKAEESLRNNGKLRLVSKRALKAELEFADAKLAEAEDTKIDLRGD